MIVMFAYPKEDLHSCFLSYGLFVPRGFVKLIRPGIEDWMMLDRFWSLLNNSHSCISILS